MAAESPNASWHPALMPNISDAPPKAEATIDATQPTSSSPEPAAQLDKTITPEAESQKMEQAPDHQTTDNAWFSQDGDGGDDAWLSSDAPEVQHASEEQAVPAPAESTEPESRISPKPKGVTSQHSSSMSFARTVSHEVNFYDDDEGGDWNLSRTDTDPFKFMPPSDRTNSFPVVPPMTQQSAVHESQPLPSSQALDVLEEAERDGDVAEAAYNSGNTHPEHAGQLRPDQQTRNRASSQSMGGDLQDSEEQALDARYEEGIPLISQQAEQEPALDSFGNSFDDEAGEGDDFFNQVQDSATDELPNGHAIHPIERKSTMQVMDSMNDGKLSRQSTLMEADEEDEEAHTQAKPEASSELAETQAPSSEDLASKWANAFAEDEDEDDFLLDDTAGESKGVDPADFFGSDDEGFLDEAEEPTAQTAPATQPVAPQQPKAPNPYTPQSVPTQQAPQTSYFPNNATAPAQFPAAPMYGSPAPATPYGSAPQYGAPPPPKPELPHAQSFADKSKGGYHSPYDLPSDLITSTVKPRKRASMQQLAQPTPPGHGPPPPARSASMSVPPTNTMSPPSSSHGLPGHPPLPMHQKPPTPAASHKDSFFEELPMAPKPRPSSRHSARGPSPAQQQPSHPPPPHHPPPPQQAPSSQPDPIAGLVAPERVSPYASLATSAHHMPPPATNTSRYSPAPGHTPGHMVPPAAPSSRYSPAPPATKGHGPYGPVGISGGTPPILPHLPRTSSPLTHCENNQGEMTIADRRASASFEPRLTRVSSLPPTREVDEEDEPTTPARSLSATHPPPPSESKYNLVSPPRVPLEPAGPLYAGQTTLSPPKRTSSYAPQSIPSAQPGFVPPPRAQTQSPSKTHGHRPATQSSDSTKRPSSAHSPASPVLTKMSQTTYAPSAYAPTVRTRGQSLTMNMVAPTDGREKDPLQRWRGVPVFAWGVGGMMVTSFPNSVPRYGMNQSVPTIIRTPGEVKLRNVKDIEPLQERLAKFPGPLRGKSKKKETVAWLSAGIDTLEKELPDVSFHVQLSLEEKRAIERLLLWKILRVFIEHDGTLEGNPTVEKAVRDILAPGTMTPTADDDSLFVGTADRGVESTSVTQMQSDGADSVTMNQVRHHLLKGESEKAVWLCVDKRLWGHAMLISHAAAPDLYQQVAQEFVRKEVNYPGHNNESMAALYKILSGNFDDCVDELVPVHARAGLQLMSTHTGPGQAKDSLEGLEKWRETLCLVLSNRRADDILGLNALGKLLSSYGRAEAAHICFMFARQASVFGGLDDPNANFVLVGSDHDQQPDQFAKETEALQLSEVYEYGLSLAGGQAGLVGVPHLAVYKLQHAMTLAEYGYRDKALQYCDAIASAITSQTKRSPYHHIILEAAVDDFMTRLKQAPKEESGSWISKPSMNKVSDSMWNRFNKFVSGDDNENGNGSGGDGESGPFGRIAGTPAASRSPSVSNFEVYAGQSPAYPPSMAQPPLTGAASRYAPSSVQAPPVNSGNPYEPTSQYAPTPRGSMDRSSGEYPRNPYEPSYPGMNSPPVQNGGYVPSMPVNHEPAPLPSLPSAPALAPAAQITQGYQPFGLAQSASMPALVQAGADPSSGAQSQGFQPLSYGYEPPSMTATEPEPHSEEPAAEASTGGYEPPSFQPYGYEPPSYEPDADLEDDDAPKPKKKSFMDDDDDDIVALKPQEKSKSEKDRENEEMFRKAAEEDAKRAAAAQGAKKGWGFSGWFGGGKKAESPSPGEASPGKPIRAKLGEASSFVYDPELKRWVNKKPGAENTPAKTATPPPPRAGPRSVSGTPPPPSATPPPMPPMPHSASAPPPLMPPKLRAGTPELNKAPSNESLAAPPMLRSVSNTSVGGPPSGPPSRPTTSMSNASSIDDLLSAAPRKPGQKKARKSGRYVDVMAK